MTYVKTFTENLYDSLMDAKHSNKVKYTKKFYEEWDKLDDYLNAIITKESLYKNVDPELKEIPDWMNECMVRLN